MNKRSLGKEYEEMTVAFLEGKGYHIIDRNYFCKYGEIDIIAKESDSVVFVEVKYRKNGKMGIPETAVDYNKRVHIKNTAINYLVEKYGTDEISCRFDVVAIMGRQIHLIRDAF